MVQQMSYKGISYLHLCQAAWSVEGNPLGCYVRGYYEEHLFEIILYLDKWISRR